MKAILYGRRYTFRASFSSDLEPLVTVDRKGYWVASFVQQITPHLRT